MTPHQIAHRVHHPLPPFSLGYPHRPLSPVLCRDHRPSPMSKLVIASLLGTLAGAAAVPSITGPVHFAVTRPFSLFGTLPSNGPGAIAMGTTPLDFILTDVLLGGSFTDIVVTVNGAPVFNCGYESYQAGQNGYQRSRSENLTSGIFIPAGSTIGVQYGIVGPGGPVTLAGYVQ